MLKTLLIIFLGYNLLIARYKLIFIGEDRRTEIIYNGMLWVFLDRYSIWKYKSDEEPLQPITILKTENRNENN